MKVVSKSGQSSGSVTQTHLSFMSDPDSAGPSTAQDKTQSKILKHEWFLRTFRSRQRTEELLRPELEAGNLTYNDYASAVQYLPHIGPRLFPVSFSQNLLV
jgi:hypothetical protein